jgi:hypothetical protein
MANLIIKSGGVGERVLELKLGVNRIGRSDVADFQIEHPTISNVHCEVKIEDGELFLRDCDSTNGTFVNGCPIKEARLQAGQSFSVGEVEVLIESTHVTVAIPKFEIPIAPPPVVRKDGSLECLRHEGVPATYRCTNCREFMCEECVTQMRRRGGKVLKLCPLCSHAVELIGAERKKKKGVLGFFQKTVKMAFLHGGKSKE